MYETFKMINLVAFIAVAAYIIFRNIHKKNSDKKD